jgi:hypothetical protein
MQDLENKSSYTVVSTSQDAVVYMIKIDDFMKHIKNDEESWNIFTMQ